MRTTIRYAAYTLAAITVFSLAWALGTFVKWQFACDTEDSTNCYWDANVRGNGAGNSFIDVNGTAYYFGIGR